MESVYYKIFDSVGEITITANPKDANKALDGGLSVFEYKELNTVTDYNRVTLIVQTEVFNWIR